ncbi:hypothetical protein [Kribbella soli]|uniref:Uncharacterized protein n=1 Tax=Kribbella soli TaxID=1124743 RepID=A0A4R0HKD8_9ACTN|nr:hypothetical protein [Kribbella soli]TCC08229.1 hypothetical protein E0H45_20200 [Kribbella soli]
MLPLKTVIEDIDGLATYLKGQVGWVPLDKAKKAIDNKLVDNRKLEATRRIGLLDRDGVNVRLTEDGRSFATGDAAQRAAIMRKAIRSVSLYAETIEWMHHSKVANPTKAEVGNYWHDKHQDQLEGAQGAALTDAVIFFMRIAGEAGLGKFTRGTKGSPDSYLKTDAAAIADFVNTSPGTATAQHTKSEAGTETPTPQNAVPATASDPPRPSIDVSASPAVHVNIEIHIAANATAETVAEIFKNMRKYVLNDPHDRDA